MFRRIIFILAAVAALVGGTAAVASASTGPSAPASCDAGHGIFQIGGFSSYVQAETIRLGVDTLPDGTTVPSLGAANGQEQGSTTTAVNNTGLSAYCASLN
jgi:hypothetical protein